MVNKSPIRLTGSYDICASHQLLRSDWSEAQNKEVFGHCTQLHGHQYKLNVTVEGAIDEDSGMLINGYALDHLVKEIVLDKIDHHHLNDLEFFKTHLPTAEWIAVWVFNELKIAFPSHVKLANIRIYETPNLYAEYGE